MGQYGKEKESFEKERFDMRLWWSIVLLPRFVSSVISFDIANMFARLGSA